jgi:hypothetical protein
MKSTGLLMCAGALVALLCGCAGGHITVTQVTGSGVVSQWEFQPPRSWVSVDPARGPFPLALSGARQWRSSDSLESISLQVMPTRQPRRLRAILDPYFTVYSRISVCRNLPALFGRQRLPFGRVISDEIAIEQRGSIAVASYYYPRFRSPDVSAEKSLRTLCPKGPRARGHA